jgi:hypothetical protein
MGIPIAFLICTEPGYLEQQSVLLAESIREFGGNLKDTPIYSFHPREGQAISRETKDAFEFLEVCHQQIILNVDYSSFGCVNKMFVCAYAEQNIEAEFLIFLDSDQCIFNEPKELLLPDEYNIGICPVVGQGIGSTGPKDLLYEDYWKKLYELFNISNELFVNTRMDNKKIRGYWNSGMVSVRRNANIFTDWKTNFKKIMEVNLLPAQGMFFVDQVALAVTICSRTKDIFSFSFGYNYPLLHHNILANEKQINSLDEIISIHYHQMFRYDDWIKKLEKLKNFKRKSIKYQWLYEKLLNQKHDTKTLTRKLKKKINKINLKLRNLKVFNPFKFIKR